MRPSQQMRDLGVVQYGAPILGEPARYFALPDERETAGTVVGQRLDAMERIRRAHDFSGKGPYPDQFARLSQVERLSPDQVEALVDQLGEVKVGPSATAPVLPPKPRRRALGMAPEVVEAQLSEMLAISTKGLPTTLLSALKHTASFHNPEFYRRQSQRYSTWDTPRLVCSFDGTNPDWLMLPRGLRDEAAQLIAAGGTLTVTSELADVAPIRARLTGELT
ncbi:hypothetical protein ACH4U6_35085 [Streptomyces netropsis]|uniref:hypothetical protein n=1 Tax=Streptomyces netropsis TaxID=55404 RepID=UPI00379AA5E4